MQRRAAHPVEDLLVVLNLPGHHQLGWKASRVNDALHDLQHSTAIEGLHHAKEAQVLRQQAEQTGGG